MLHASRLPVRYRTDGTCDDDGSTVDVHLTVLTAYRYCPNQECFTGTGTWYQKIPTFGSLGYSTTSMNLFMHSRWFPSNGSRDGRAQRGTKLQIASLGKEVFEVVVILFGIASS